MGLYAYGLATGLAFIVSVFCSIAEGALLNYSPSRLEAMLKDPTRRARIERHLSSIDRYIFSAIILNALSDVALVFACTLGFYRGEEVALAGVKALATSLLVVIVGAEVVPRAFASRFADALLPRVLPPLAVADRVFAPIIFPLRKLHDAIAAALAGGDGEERRVEEIKDDIRSAALEASREGVIDPQVSEMIEAAIDFRDTEVHEIMTPRTEMASIEVSTPVQEAVKIALEQGHSRIPVFESTRDKIIGVLYSKDLLLAWQKAGAKPQALALRPLLRKPYFVPETKLIGELLREFRARKVHIAIVLDEHGATAGLVTIEDIIEAVVGEIEDEYEPAGDATPALKWIDDRTAEVDAKLHVQDVNEALDIALPTGDGEYETLGGFVFAATGKVPKKGDKVAHDDAEITVIDGDERKIDRVRIQVKRKQAAR